MGKYEIELQVEKVKVSVVDAKINELQSSLKALTRRVVGLDVKIAQVESTEGSYKTCGVLANKEELKNTTIKMAEQSKVLNNPGAEKQTKRELFDALRQELEAPVLEKDSKLVWELILDSNGLGKEISEMVEKDVTANSLDAKDLKHTAES
nr:hypothetical protein CFP56_37465 [Quercus suber]